MTWMKTLMQLKYMMEPWYQEAGPWKEKKKSSRSNQGYISRVLRVMKCILLKIWMSLLLFVSGSSCFGMLQNWVTEQPICPIPKVLIRFRISMSFWKFSEKAKCMQWKRNIYHGATVKVFSLQSQSNFSGPTGEKNEVWEYWSLLQIFVRHRKLITTLIYINRTSHTVYHAFVKIS